jgi:hypothetical protein
MIVARHEVQPGTKCLGQRPAREPSRRVRYESGAAKPRGISRRGCVPCFLREAIYFVFKISSLQIQSARTPARIRPYPTGRFFGWRRPRHFVPGYNRTVPPGQKPFAHQSIKGPRAKSALMGGAKPSSESSCRDEEPSQTVLILVPFSPGLSFLGRFWAVDPTSNAQEHKVK